MRAGASSGFGHTCSGSSVAGVGDRPTSVSATSARAGRQGLQTRSCAKRARKAHTCARDPGLRSTPWGRCKPSLTGPAPPWAGNIGALYRVRGRSSAMPERQPLRAIPRLFGRGAPGPMLTEKGMARLAWSDGSDLNGCRRTMALASCLPGCSIAQAHRPLSTGRQTEACTDPVEEGAVRPPGDQHQHGGAQDAADQAGA